MSKWLFLVLFFPFLSALGSETKYRDFVKCDEGYSYFGGWSLEVQISESSSSARMQIRRDKGPDGDGLKVEEVQIDGIYNSDERDPYSFVFQFGKFYELEVLTQQKNGFYPGVVKFLQSKDPLAVDCRF
jgi:hypothetical protein